MVTGQICTETLLHEGAFMHKDTYKMKINFKKSLTTVRVRDKSESKKK